MAARLAAGRGRARPAVVPGPVPPASASPARAGDRRAAAKPSSRHRRLQHSLRSPVRFEKRRKARRLRLDRQAGRAVQEPP
jgi:hypothetical protein